jgi:hypothetical protein
MGKITPFTFTSEGKNHLEFMIVLTEIRGVTNMLGRTNAGAQLILHDVLGQSVTKVR